jgi:hypothetical protein
MFGGVCFMFGEKMGFGSFLDGLMVRVDSEEVEKLLKRDFVTQMTQASLPMIGFLIVKMEVIDMESDLDFWIGKCLEFNPKANKEKK